MALDYITATAEVGKMLGDQAYRNGMNGAMSDWYGVDFDTAAGALAIVYGVEPQLVAAELREIAEEQHTERFAQHATAV